MMEFAAPSSSGGGATSGKSGKEPPATDCGLSGDWGPGPAGICKLEDLKDPQQCRGSIVPPEFCKSCDQNYAFKFVADGKDGTLMGTFSELVKDRILEGGFVVFEVETTPLLGYFHEDTCAFQFVGGQSYATAFEGYILDGEMHIQATRMGPLNDGIFPLAWKGLLYPKKYNEVNTEVCPGTLESLPPGPGSPGAPQPTDEFFRLANPDTFNGGCPLSLGPFEFNTENSGFSDITFGETISGSTSTFQTTELDVRDPFTFQAFLERDFDWYKFTLDEPGFISITLTSNVPILFALYKFSEEGCDGFNPENDILLQEEATFAPSTDINISVELDAPGDYVLQLQVLAPPLGNAPFVTGVQRGGYLLSLFEGSIEGAIMRDVTDPVVGETLLDWMDEDA